MSQDQDNTASTNYTFWEKDKIFQISVKPEYLKICSDPENVDFAKQLVEFQIGKYFHNTNGPAIYNAVKDFSEYYIDGKYQEPDSEVVQKIKHNNQFTAKFKDELLKD